VWIEVRFTVAGDDAELWSDALLEAGALSVQSEDADADSPAEVALYGEPGEPAPASSWQRTRLAALLDASRPSQRQVEEAARAAGLEMPEDMTYREVLEQDWVRLTQSQFEPIPVGQRLLIAPSWHEAAIAQARTEGREVIELDPGLAFGTGSHPTTRMCLDWIDQHLKPGGTVIDYGCGSGILAIACARLGAADVLAVDIDPQAVEAADTNARLNRAAVRCVLADANIGGTYDLVLANILANPLRMLAPLLTARLAPGGTLVLSGLLASQSEEIARYYPGVALKQVAECEGWACLAGVLRPLP
jgi:ribosomal protein L11 methyltransferase